jgi:G3E family GTPase
MVRFIALSGFLGAGKTTTMTRAARQLREAGLRVAVITNDQGSDLVDTALAATGGAGLGVGEVTGGCFCCRFDDLMDVTGRLVEQHRPDVVIAESVGSCTDLTATVVRPLVALFGDRFSVAPLTTIVDPIRYQRLARELDRGDAASDVAYLYAKQLADAAVIGVNKIDLLEEDEVGAIAGSLTRRFPRAEVVTYSAAQDYLSPLLAAWNRHYRASQNSAGHSSNGTEDLDLDYERYGTAEARLAWLDRAVDVEAVGDAFAPAAWARTALETVARHCNEANLTVGHVKMIIEDAASPGITKASLVDANRSPNNDLRGPVMIHRGRVLFNARVECAPHELEVIVTAAARAADTAHGTHSASVSQRSFRPGRPVPTHRMLVNASEPRRQPRRAVTQL